MGLIASTFLAAVSVLVTIIVATASRLIADDAKAWLPKIVEGLIDRAVTKLPPEHRDRFAEEWRSHVNDTSGDISKLLMAIGCLRASRLMAAREIAVPRLQRAIAVLLILSVAPTMFFIAVSIRIVGGPGPVLIRRRVLVGGIENWVLNFRIFYAAENVEHDRAKRRMTRVGRLLHRFSLDEMPMLFDIAQGRVRFPKRRWKK